MRDPLTALFLVESFCSNRSHGRPLLDACVIGGSMSARRRWMSFVRAEEVFHVDANRWETTEKRFRVRSRPGAGTRASDVQHGASGADGGEGVVGVDGIRATKR